MTDFISDGAPVETPLAAATEGYATVNRGLGAYLGAMANEGVTGFLARAAARGQYTDASGFDRALAQYQTPEEAEAAAYGFGATPPSPAPGPMLAPDDYNKRFAPTGPDGRPVALGDKPMSEGLARLIGEQKSAQMEREGVIARFEDAHSTPVDLAAGAVGSLLDPANAAASLVPALGEDLLAARLGAIGIRGLAARTLARAGAGAVTGAAIAVPQAGVEAVLSPEEATDYTLGQALREVGFSAAGFAGLHVLGGAMGDAYRAMRGRPANPAAALAAKGEPDLTAAARDIATAPAASNRDAMASAVAQIGDERPVDVAAIATPAAAPEASLADVAAKQRLLDEDGYAAGVAPDEFAGTVDAVDNPIEDAALGDSRHANPIASRGDEDAALGDSRHANPIASRGDEDAALGDSRHANPIASRGDEEAALGEGRPTNPIAARGEEEVPAPATAESAGAVSPEPGSERTEPENAAPGAPEAAGAPVASPAASPERITLGPRVPRPRDIVQFLAANGGLEPSGDLAAMDAHKKFVPGAGMLVRKEGAGLEHDRAREMAQEAGYLPRDNPNRPSQSTVSDLYDAIDETLRGNPRFSDHDAGQLADYRDYQQRLAEARLSPEERAQALADERASLDAQRAARVADIHDAAKRQGVTLDDEEAEEAASLVGQGHDMGDAIDEALERSGIRQQSDNIAARRDIGEDIPYDDGTGQGGEAGSAELAAARGGPTGAGRERSQPAGADAGGERASRPEPAGHSQPEVPGGEAVAHGPFGPIFHDVATDWPKAVARLKAARDGEVPGALHHPGLGAIDVPWGQTGRDGFGLAHIIEKHPAAVADLPALVRDLPLAREEEGGRKAILESADHRVVVRLDYDGRAKTWLLTAFERKDGPGAAAGGSRAGGATRSAPSRPGGERGAEPDGNMGAPRAEGNAPRDPDLAAAERLLADAPTELLGEADRAALDASEQAVAKAEDQAGAADVAGQCLAGRA